MEEPIIIDPRILISPPYIACVNCKKENCYGVLMVNSKSFTRRCRECWFIETYKLPPLTKKIIYLDQFAVSEMMKAVNKRLGKSAKIDQYWFDIFERLEALTKLQLIVCPDSTFQQEESVFHDYKALKRMYEQFSQGLSFYDPSTIKRFQLTEHFKKYLNIYNEKQDLITIHDVIAGDVEGWQDRLFVTINYKMDQEEINKMKLINNECDQSLIKTFERWKSEKNKKFKDWYIEEGMIWGKIKVKQYVKEVMQPSDFLMPSEESVLISSLLKYIPKKIKDDKDAIKVFSFLLSENLLEVPFNKINALLWAGIAHQAAHGSRKRPPNVGMVNDISMVSTLLPYCDAIFVDNEMHSLLKQGQIKKEVDKYKTQIFSLSDRDSFINYLDEIKNQASKEHLNKVVEVYGEDWGRPYWSMYEKNKVADKSS